MFTINTLKQASKTFTMLLVATMVSYGAVATLNPSVAEAGLKKKVQFATKAINKVSREMEKAGRAAQRKGGAGKVFGGILKNAGKGTEKVGKAADKTVSAVTRGTNKVMSKSKVGRSVQKGWRNAVRIENKIIDKGFGKCTSGLCKGAREGVRLFSPL
jgi:flagellar hook-basal body complex protein FliE